MPSVSFSAIFAVIVLFASYVQAAKLALKQLSIPPFHPKAAGGVVRQVTPESQNVTLDCELLFPSYVGSCLTSEEVQLGNLINSYRAEQNKSQLPFSKTLSTVAQAHAFDFETNSPDLCGGNLNSWSGNCSTWSPVCYTPDHAQAAGMWEKPMEFNPAFSDFGFEISAWYSGGQTASRAFGQWKESKLPNDVIVENDVWGSAGPFQSMGIGLYENSAKVWFSFSSDPAGDMELCGKLEVQDEDGDESDGDESE